MKPSRRYIASSVAWDSGRHNYWQNDYSVKLGGVSCPEGSWNSCAYRTTDLSCSHVQDVFIQCEGWYELKLFYCKVCDIYLYSCLLQIVIQCCTDLKLLKISLNITN